MASLGEGFLAGANVVASGLDSLVSAGETLERRKRQRALDPINLQIREQQVKNNALGIRKAERQEKLDIFMDPLKRDKITSEASKGQDAEVNYLQNQLSQYDTPGSLNLGQKQHKAKIEARINELRPGMIGSAPSTALGEQFPPQAPVAPQADPKRLEKDELADNFRNVMELDKVGRGKDGPAMTTEQYKSFVKSGDYIEKRVLGAYATLVGQGEMAEANDIFEEQVKNMNDSGVFGEGKLDYKQGKDGSLEMSINGKTIFTYTKDDLKGIDEKYDELGYNAETGDIFDKNYPDVKLDYRAQPIKEEKWEDLLNNPYALKSRYGLFPDGKGGAVDASGKPVQFQSGVPSREELNALAGSVSKSRTEARRLNDPTYQRQSALMDQAAGIKREDTKTADRVKRQDSLIKRVETQEAAIGKGDIIPARHSDGSLMRRSNGTYVTIPKGASTYKVIKESLFEPEKRLIANFVKAQENLYRSQGVFSASDTSTTTTTGEDKDSTRKTDRKSLGRKSVGAMPEADKTIFRDTLATKIMRIKQARVRELNKAGKKYTQQNISDYALGKMLSDPKNKKLLSEMGSVKDGVKGKGSKTVTPEAEDIQLEPKAQRAKDLAEEEDSDQTIGEALSDFKNFAIGYSDEHIKAVHEKWENRADKKGLKGPKRTRYILDNLKDDEQLSRGEASARAFTYLPKQILVETPRVIIKKALSVHDQSTDDIRNMAGEKWTSGNVSFGDTMTDWKGEYWNGNKFSSMGRHIVKKTLKNLGITASLNAEETKEFKKLISTRADSGTPKKFALVLEQFAKDIKPALFEDMTPEVIEEALVPLRAYLNKSKSRGK